MINDTQYYSHSLMCVSEFQPHNHVDLGINTILLCIKMNTYVYNIIIIDNTLLVLYVVKPVRIALCSSEQELCSIYCPKSSFTN